ncbi:hypothetical protein [Bacteroides heparinolyticus]|uniref:hypothetical protein n=1 Tax=Prevotella heparinolytica TaxID=28113 RepID=UPI0023F50801|nr:hypothetical protein [Bacteroides heparinolyticus]
MNHQGRFGRFSADYALNDLVRLSAGFAWFGGDEGVLGLYERNSEVWARQNTAFSSVLFRAFLLD